MVRGDEKAELLRKVLNEGKAKAAAEGIRDFFIFLSIQTDTVGGKSCWGTGPSLPERQPCRRRCRYTADIEPSFASQRARATRGERRNKKGRALPRKVPLNDGQRPRHPSMLGIADGMPQRAGRDRGSL